MSSVPLPADDLHRRVAGTVGRLDADALTQLPMRPERGCMSLVSVRSFFFLVSDCPWFSQLRLFVHLQELGFHKPSLPPVPEDAVDRAARKRLGPASRCGLGTPWRGVVGNRRGTGSRGSRHRRRLTTTTTMTKTTTWLLALASARI
jgi:hypothetical protein